MAGITIRLEPEIKSRIESFFWVNWSAIAREEVLKKDIFERYLKERKLKKDDQIFCDKMDWHPVDWLPLKKSYIQKLKKISHEPSKKMTIEGLNKLMGLK